MLIVKLTCHSEGDRQFRKVTIPPPGSFLKLQASFSLNGNPVPISWSHDVAT